MSLKDLVLTDEMIAQLYGRSLVQLSAPGPDAPQAASLKWLGANEKNITVVVNSPGHAFLSEEDMSLLIKMLSACKLHTGDVAILNMAAQPLVFTDIRRTLAPSQMLIAGLPPAAIGLPVADNLFDIQLFEGMRLLCAPALSELQLDVASARALKTRLWGSLKQLFDIR